MTEFVDIKNIDPIILFKEKYEDAKQADQKNIEAICISSFNKTKKEVDDLYKNLFPSCPPPKENERYNIYQFFAEDPEGRTLEFQHFLHPIDWVWS